MSTLTDEEHQQIKGIVLQFRIAALALIFVLALGSVFYHYAEGWGWVDSLYFCVVTLSTVGYGDFSPTTTGSKLFTIFYILTGIGLLATFANLALKRAVAARKLRR